MKQGKVYFVSAPGRIKIGYTVNPDDRLEKLRQADMEPLSVIAVIDGTRRLERHLHEKLSPFRLKGEWFLDCAAVRDAMNECLSSRPIFAEESGVNAPSTLDEARFVSEATQYCAKLILFERSNGATTAEALSLIAIKTGISHNRIWQLQYRKPKSVTAAEITALRDIAGADDAAVRAAKAVVGEEN